MRVRALRSPAVLCTVVLTTASLVLTGCSSSGSGGGGGGSASSKVVSEAKSLAAPYTKRPGLEVTTPITKTIPTGKKLDLLTCSSPGCAAIASAFKQAAGVLGWSVKVLTVDPTADAITNAYNTAIRDKPDGVAVAAVSAEVAKHQLATLQSMHIPVVTVQDPDVKFGPIIASLYTHDSSNKLGKVTADYTTGDMGCTNTLYVQLSGYLVLQFRLKAYEAEMKRLSPKLKYKVLNLAATTTDFVSPIVSAVRADPSINCVYVSSDPFAVGLPQGFKSAGVSLPKIITDFAGNTTLQYIHNGQATATDVGDPGSYGYIYLDTFARYFSGQSVVPDEKATQNFWFVNKSNAPTSVPFSDVVNLQSKYAKLWGKA